MPGVLAVDVEPGKTRVTVAYDPRATTPAVMLAALRTAREDATRVLPPGQHDLEYIEAVERAQGDRPPALTRRARIAPQDEPGTPLVLHGRVFAADGTTPVGDAVVFGYHTDREGHYDRPGRGPHSWRLRGWARTDADGSFEFATTRPGAYPGRREAAHVHLTVFTSSGRFHAGVVEFADDPLVTPAMREASRLGGRFGSVREVRQEGATQHVDAALRLESKVRF
jgi:protocatechuate 3,4-dioxygenase beta subunit